MITTPQHALVSSIVTRNTFTTISGLTSSVDHMQALSTAYYNNIIAWKCMLVIGAVATVLCVVPTTFVPG